MEMNQGGLRHHWLITQYRSPLLIRKFIKVCPLSQKSILKAMKRRSSLYMSTMLSLPLMLGLFQLNLKLRRIWFKNSFQNQSPFCSHLRTFLNIKSKYKTLSIKKSQELYFQCKIVMIRDCTSSLNMKIANRFCT